MSIGSKIGYFILLSAAITATAQAQVCQKVHSNTSEIRQEVRPKDVIPVTGRLATRKDQLVAALKSLSPALVRGEANPSVREIHKLERIIQTFKLSSTDPQKLKDLQTAVLSEKFPEIPPAPTVIARNLLEYRMRGAYQERLRELNKWLPPQRQIPITRIALPESAPTLKERMQRLVQKLDALQDIFFKKMGYENYGEFLAKLRADRQHESVKDTLELIDRDDLEFAMMTPSGLRESVMIGGFHNQHAVGRTKGFEGLNARNTVEAGFTNQKYEDYAKLSADHKPLFGFLRPHWKTGLKGSLPTHYGDDVYFFKKDRMKDRVTFTIGDSLDEVSVRNTELKPELTHIPSNWDQSFIPWSRKEFIALFQNAEYSLQTHGFSMDPGNAVRSSIQRHYNLNWTFARSGYVELQYWMPPELNDVHAFGFTKNPPEGAFLQALRERNVEIYDLREVASGRGTPVLWNGDVAPRTPQYWSPYIIHSPPQPFERGTPPQGPLKLLPRKEFGITEGQWYKDAQKTEWFVKKDEVPDLQSSAEIIGTLVYRVFGYETPDTFKFRKDGKTFIASRKIKGDPEPLDLGKANGGKIRELRIYSAFLKDWDRIANPMNNLKRRSDQSLVLIDLGGALGSTAAGIHKPGKAFSAAVGVYETYPDFRSLYDALAVDTSADHPWRNLTREDAQNAVMNLSKLTDALIVQIVTAAQYQDPKDSAYMIHALQNNRDVLIRGLQNEFEGLE